MFIGQHAVLDIDLSRGEGQGEGADLDSGWGSGEGRAEDRGGAGCEDHMLDACFRARLEHVFGPLHSWGHELLLPTLDEGRGQ